MSETEFNSPPNINEAKLVDEGPHIDPITGRWIDPPSKDIPITELDLKVDKTPTPVLTSEDVAEANQSMIDTITRK